MSFELSTIKFNVGGRIFEVNRSLLQYFPNSLLAKLAEEITDDENNVNDNNNSNNSTTDTYTASTSNNNSTTVLFIDRDSNRFECILNYLRDGVAEVPINISKESLLIDFAYYGLDPIHRSSIRTLISLPDACCVLKTLKEKYMNRKEEICNKIKKLETETEYKIKQLQAETAQTMLLVAKETEDMIMQGFPTETTEKAETMLPTMEPPHEIETHTIDITTKTEQMQEEENEPIAYEKLPTDTELDAKLQTENEIESKIKELQTEGEFQKKKLEKEKMYHEFAYRCFVEFSKKLRLKLAVPVSFDFVSTGSTTRDEVVPTNTLLQEYFYEFGLILCKAGKYAMRSFDEERASYYSCIVRLKIVREAGVPSLR